MAGTKPEPGPFGPLLQSLHTSFPKNIAMKTTLRLTAALSISLFINTAHAEFSVIGEPNNSIGKLANSLSSILDTNGPITIIIKPCGYVNAFWSENGTLTYCTETIQMVENRANNAIRNGISAESARAEEAGEKAFILFHELGHAMIHRHHLPFTGHEEDAADQFAAYLLMQSRDPRLYIGGINFFAEPQPLFKWYKKSELTDEHGLSIQRRTQLTCWGYGRSPSLFAPLANQIKISRERLQRCGEEYRNLTENTPRLFAAAIKKTADTQVNDQ